MVCGGGGSWDCSCVVRCGIFGRGESYIYVRVYMCMYMYVCILYCVYMYVYMYIFIFFYCFCMYVCVPFKYWICLGDCVSFMKSE